MGSSGGIRSTVPGDFTVPNGNVNVTGGGKFLVGSYKSAAGFAQAFDSNGGGLVQLGQGSAPSLSGSATQVRLEVVAGTTGNKLIAVTNTASYTILDNIV